LLKSKYGYFPIPEILIGYASSSVICKIAVEIRTIASVGVHYILIIAFYLGSICPWLGTNLKFVDSKLYVTVSFLVFSITNWY